MNAGLVPGGCILSDRQSTSAVSLESACKLLPSLPTDAISYYSSVQKLVHEFFIDFYFCTFLQLFYDLFRFPNLAVCNITRDSIRAALSIGITADQVQSPQSYAIYYTFVTVGFMINVKFGSFFFDKFVRIGNKTKTVDIFGRDNCVFVTFVILSGRTTSLWLLYHAMYFVNVC